MSPNGAIERGVEGGPVRLSRSPTVLPPRDDDTHHIDLDVNGVLHEGTTSTAEMPAASSSSPASSLFTDVANMLKAFIGLNFMYVAYAFAQAGLVRGIIGLCLIALITEHCCLLLVDVKSRMPPKPGSSKPPTYGDIGRFVGGRPVEYMVNGALMITQFGYCVGYLIFMSQTIHDVLQRTNPATWMYVLFPVPILLGIAMLKSIRSLGPFSILANAALLTGFVAVVVYIGKHFKYHVGTTSWGTYPLFFGQMTAALEGIGLVIPVETSMKDPSQFPFVLRIALFILISVLMTVGTLGYMTFGAETKSILLLNFGQSPVVNVVKVILILGILFTYPLQIFPVFQLFENWVAKRQEKREARSNASSPANGIRNMEEGKSGQIAERGSKDSVGENDNNEGDMLVSNEDEELEEQEWREKKERFVQEPWKVMFRLGIVLATAMTAMVAGANFGLFQSLVGSLGASCLAYSAPAYFHVTVFGRTLSRGEKLKDWLIFAFGVVGAIIGTICTLMEFVEKRQHGHV